MTDGTLKAEELLIQLNAARLVNLKEARRVIAAVPEDSVQLDQYRKDTDCGTLFCTAGHLTEDPFFKQKGLCLKSMSVPHVNGPQYMLSVNGANSFTTFEIVNDLFGPGAFSKMFARYAEGIMDTYIFKETANKNMSHKELALARIDREIDRMTK